jgi:uncharacterized protein DUF4266
MKRLVARCSLLIVLGTAAASLAGCATVQPWQRGRLADRWMQFDPDTGRVSYMTHWLESREGSSGGFGVQGGGCGCK